jgi:hypothetical protein
MFKSTYGYRSLEQFNGSSPLIHKAVDFERSYEIFPIGSMLGEDVPFHGQIYCLKTATKSIPFVYGVEKVLDRIDIFRFNKSKYRFSANLIGCPSAEIQIVSGSVFNIGVELGSIKTGPRGQAHWDRELSGSLSTASAHETEEVFALAQEALPVIRFDSYGLFGPSPAICIGVTNSPSPEQPSAQIEKLALVTSERLLAVTKENISVDRFFSNLAVISAGKPIKLEILFAEILDIERRIFTHGWESSVPIQNDKRLWELLRSSYEAYYHDYCDCFERFLLSVIDLINSRKRSREFFQIGLRLLRGYGC